MNRKQGDISNSLWLHEIQRQARRIKACESLAELRWLARKLRQTELASNRFISNSLIETFGKLGGLDDACAVFDSIPSPNVFSFNILMAALTQNGQLLEARSVFDSMPHRDVVSWTGMITAYAERGLLEEARSFFDLMPERNSVSWNIMVEAYAHLGHLEEAANLLHKMPEADAVSWTSLLVAYSEQGYSEEARWMCWKMPERDVVAWTAMLHAYAQTGDLVSSLKLFLRMPDRNLVSWNAMLQCCAHNQRLHLLQLMNMEGEAPDHNTFISVLHACSHWGLVEESLKHFGSISSDHNQAPTSQHQSCVIDILGRAGRLDEAEEFLKQLQPNGAAALHWNTLTTAAKFHGDVEHCVQGAMNLIALNPNRFNSATYVTLTDLLKAQTIQAYNAQS